jgi:hypothetical protein
MRGTSIGDAVVDVEDEDADKPKPAAAAIAAIAASRPAARGLRLRAR